MLRTHPESANAFDSLGDYYVAKGDKTRERAIEGLSAGRR